MDAMVIPVIALTIPMIVAPTAIICGLFRKKREMEHLERMRALELGRTLPQDEPWWTPPRIAVAIGGGVPLASLFTAFIATGSLHGNQAEPVQIISGAIGVLSVLVGGFLAARHIGYYHYNRAPERLMTGVKPQSYDPDAFDVVGSRGR